MHRTDHDEDAASVSDVATDFSTGDGRDSDLSCSPQLATDDLQLAGTHNLVVKALKSLWYKFKAAGRALRRGFTRVFHWFDG